MDQVILVKHSLIDHSLTILRDKKTKTENFRKHASIVSTVLLLEVMKNLHLTNVPIETPLTKTLGKKLKENIIIVPVLRSGLCMIMGLEGLLPAMNVGFIGLARDEKTAQAHEYYKKLPKIFASHLVLLVDPMLATGGSLDESIQMLEKQGAKHIVIVCIVSAPEGLHYITKKFPHILIYTAAIDKKLNDRKFIVPGLGDFGDRYFGTV